jgi:hypothetical protein
VIVKFEERSSEKIATLAIDELRYTTLENAVVGLTAGKPVSLDEFEQKIRAKLPD